MPFQLAHTLITWGTKSFLTLLTFSTIWLIALIVSLQLWAPISATKFTPLEPFLSLASCRPFAATQNHENPSMLLIFLARLKDLISHESTCKDQMFAYHQLFFAGCVASWQNWDCNEVYTKSKSLRNPLLCMLLELHASNVLAFLTDFDLSAACSNALQELLLGSILEKLQNLLNTPNS